jgi:hypothetical protein
MHRQNSLVRLPVKGSDWLNDAPVEHSRNDVTLRQNRQLTVLMVMLLFKQDQHGVTPIPPAYTVRRTLSRVFNLAVCNLRLPLLQAVSFLLQVQVPLCW